MHRFHLIHLFPTLRVTTIHIMTITISNSRTSSTKTEKFTLSTFFKSIILAVLIVFFVMKPIIKRFILNITNTAFHTTTSIDFSISHSADIVWVALCRTATVGIDLEQLRPLPDAAQLTGQLHPQERQTLLALPNTELEKAFFRCWTRKEAVLKACGTGLNTPLNSFCVSCEQQQDNWILAAPAPGNCVAQCTTATSDQWTSHDIAAVAAYQCSVAACAPQLEVLVHVM